MPDAPATAQRDYARLENAAIALAYRRIIIGMHERGYSGADIGRALGVSRQYVSQIVNDPRNQQDS